MTPLRTALVATLVLGLSSGLLGCRDDSVGTTSGGGDDGQGGSTGSDDGTGGAIPLFICPEPDAPAPDGCEGPVVGIADLTTGEVGLDLRVTLKDVVATSQKFLVSQSKATGSCLWGVFVSEQVPEAAANTGMLVLAYGSPAFIPVGDTKAACPKLGQEPACDSIPDDVKPGDVLTVVGENQIFPNPPVCTGDNPPNEVGMRQLASTCHVERTGSAPVPTPHVLTPDEVVQITSPTDAAFHSAWGAVKVRVENVGVIPNGDEIVGGFGIITLANQIPVGDKVYYRPYSENYCHQGPVFTNPGITFQHVDGFHYLNFCSWGIEPNDKCLDFQPSSEDCTANTCTVDVMPPTP